MPNAVIFCQRAKILPNMVTLVAFIECCKMCSVTRFADICYFWQKFKRLWQFLMGLHTIWQIFSAVGQV